jgi:hypothetical protein
MHQSPDSLFLMQVLCVNIDKAVSIRKYRDTVILPGDAITLVASSGSCIRPLSLCWDLVCRWSWWIVSFDVLRSNRRVTAIRVTPLNSNSDTTLRVHSEKPAHHSEDALKSSSRTQRYTEIFNAWNDPVYQGHRHRMSPQGERGRIR